MDVVNKALQRILASTPGGGLRNGMQAPVFEGGNAYMDAITEAGPIVDRTSRELAI